MAEKILYKCKNIAGLSILICSLLLPGFAFASSAVFWISRHGEDMVELVDLGNGAFQENCNDVDCCIEPLSSLGKKRAELLVRYFKKSDLLDKFTHVIASHKIRTNQLVGPTADAAGILIQKTPVGVQECDVGYESAGTSRLSMLAAMEAVPEGSIVLVGAHSGTIYKIMDSLGIDTSDPVDFPRAPNGKVSGFNNLWKITRNEQGVHKFKKHLVVDFVLKKQHDD